MSSKIEVQLTQYTPLLHFQGQQEGACLRASEVKPALDHFITAWLKKINKAAPPQWIQSEVNGHTAYRYRMTFTANGEPEHQKSQNNKPERPYFYMYKTTNSKGKMVVRGDIHQLFFAAMGDDAFDSNGESRIKGVFYPEGMTMMILVPGDQGNKLSALLKKLIPPFFALHCFGNRSNKGFGSSGVTKMDGEDIPVMTPAQLAEYAPNQKTLYYVSYGSTADLTYTNYLDDVFMLSQIIKAGLNYTFVNENSYYKGLIFKYFLDKIYKQDEEIHSEKRFIKDQMICLSGDIAQQTLFVRSLIGLPQNYDFNTYYTRPNSFNVEVSHQDIERYENPIHFKPYGSYLIIIPQIIPTEKMCGTDFILHSKETDRNKRVVEEITKTIQTPSDFNLISFLDYCVEKYGIDRSELIDHFEDRGATKSIHSSIIRVESIEKAEPKAGEQNNG